MEDLTVEEFVSQPPVEALDVAILPWRSRLDIQGLHIQPCKPCANGLASAGPPVIEALREDEHHVG